MANALSMNMELREASRRLPDLFSSSFSLLTMPFFQSRHACNLCLNWWGYCHMALPAQAELREPMVTNALIVQIHDINRSLPWQ